MSSTTALARTVVLRVPERARTMSAGATMTIAALALGAVAAGQGGSLAWLPSGPGSWLPATSALHWVRTAPAPAHRELVPPVVPAVDTLTLRVVADVAKIAPSAATSAANAAPAPAPAPAPAAAASAAADPASAREDDDPGAALEIAAGKVRALPARAAAAAMAALAGQRDRRLDTGRVHHPSR